MQAAATTPAPQAGTPTAPVVAGGAQPIALGGPTTIAEVRNLRAHRSEVSSQISNVESRRGDLATQLRAATPGPDKAGIQARLQVLDNRLASLETDLAVTGQQLANARGAAATYTEQPAVPSGDLSSGQITGISIVFTLAVLMPLAIAWARAIVRRSRRDAEAPSAHLMQRLERMDEGIDAIAVEVERISEGQRFVTRLLGEGAVAPIAAGKGGAEPVALPRGEPARAERGG